MSWTRTSTALIGFGFTIYQFFDHLAQMPGVGEMRHPQMPRIISLALIAVGVVATVFAIREYRGMIHYLWSDTFHDIAGLHERPSWTPMLTISILLAAIGVVTFASLLLRTLSP